MRMLILGSSGLIGQAVAASARSEGIFVVGVSRDTDFVSRHEDRHLNFDCADASAVRVAVRDQAIDLIVDVIAYTEARTRPILSLIDGQIDRYVMVSSSDVYRNYGLLHRRESGTTDDVLTEESGLRVSEYPYRTSVPRSLDDPLQWHDDYDKIPIEKAVQALTSDWTIARLPMVFGPGDQHARFGWALGPMLANETQIEIPAAWLGWTTTYGFVENMGVAVCHTALHPAAANEILNIADFEPVENREWFSRFQRATGWGGKLIESDAASPATTRLDLTVPLRIDASRLYTRLAFTPSVDLDGAIAATIASHG
jgi:nucleoside-diphosphate-sugar epimerase